MPTDEGAMANDPPQPPKRARITSTVYPTIRPKSPDDLVFVPGVHDPSCKDSVPTRTVSEGVTLPEADA